MDEANDIAQDVFLRAYIHLAEFESSRSFAGWILLTARNSAIDSLRRQSRSTTLVSRMRWAVCDFVNPEDLVVQDEEATIVHSAIALLPQRYRTVIELYYFRDLRYTEIAIELNVPLGTVKTFLSRAKSRLRTHISETNPLTLLL